MSGLCTGVGLLLLLPALLCAYFLFVILVSFLLSDLLISLLFMCGVIKALIILVPGLCSGWGGGGVVARDEGNCLYVCRCRTYSFFAVHVHFHILVCGVVVV